MKFLKLCDTLCGNNKSIQEDCAKETARKQAAEGRGCSTAHRTGLYLVWCENKHVTMISMYYGAEVQTVVKWAEEKQKPVCVRVIHYNQHEWHWEEGSALANVPSERKITNK